MSLKTSVVLLMAVWTQALAQDARPAITSWTADMNAGKAAFTSGNYPEAVEKYRAALAKAEESAADPATLLPILKSLAAALRTNADPAAAQLVLERTLVMVVDAHGPNGLEVAPVLSELAVVQRAQDLRAEAIVSLRRALAIRGRTPINEETARDATLMATVFHEMGEDVSAANYFEMAISLWGMLPDSGLQVLTAIDPLAAIHRNENRYQRAETLYLWALRLREASLGPKDAELISTLDSLAYVQFGLKKYSEAEKMYKRLLELWETVGGPDHPMLSLTLDKMVEFYLEQKRYDEAAPLSRRALAIRSKETVETLHRTGRILTGQKKIDEATDVYSRALRIAADAGVPDEEIPGMLKAYALLLRQRQREKDALVIDKRMKDATDRKAEKEGKRPAVPAGPQPPPAGI